jgi:signal peptidase I
VTPAPRGRTPAPPSPAAPRRRWWLFGLGLLALLLPFAFFELHAIDGVSMWPAYEDGVLVLVRRSDERPARFAPIIVEAPGLETRTVLKRAVAFGGETVFISDGDLLVNGESPPRTADFIFSTRIPVMELSSLTTRLRGERRRITDRLNREAILPLEGSLALSDDGHYLRLVPATAGAKARLRMPGNSLRDDHRSPSGRWTAGREVVVDPIVTLRIHRLDAEGRLVLRQMIDGEEQARLEVRRRGEALRFRLSSDGAKAREVERVAPLDARLRWLLVDDRRRLQIERANGDEFETLDEGPRRPPRGARESWLELATEGSELTLSQLDIDRDIHYTSPQTDAAYGVKIPFRVPAGQVFTLGDNSSESRDSRHWGAIEMIDHLVGFPVAVTWPRKRMRFTRQGP